MERIETSILKNLIYNEEYSRKVIPFIKPEYFEQRSEKVIFEEITNFIVKYGSAITIEALNIETENRTDLTENEIKEVRELNSSFEETVVENQWLLDSTEKWCRDRAIYLALMESISLADGKDESKGRDAIPSILSDALSVSFDNHIGHDYLNDYEERYESYHRKEDKIPFDLEFFNKLGITLNKAITEDKNITKGIEIHPNQKPIADKSFASPKPIPSFFLIFIYKVIIPQIKI